MDDFVEPEVGLAAAAIALLASPPARRIVRRGAVYAVTGLIAVGDVLLSGLESLVREASPEVAPLEFEDIGGDASHAPSPRTNAESTPGTADR